MERRKLHNEALWELLPGMDAEWSGEREQGEPHGGGILTYGRPRDTITGTMNHGCLVGPYICFYAWGKVKLVRDQSHYYASEGYVMEIDLHGLTKISVDDNTSSRIRMRPVGREEKACKDFLQLWTAEMNALGFSNPEGGWDWIYLNPAILQAIKPAVRRPHVEEEEE